MIIRRGCRLTGQYQSVYPPAHSDTYVKATSKATTDYWPYFATDPAKSVIGAESSNSWNGSSGSITNQRFHIDLGSMKVIGRIYYENHHNSGADTNIGAKNFILQGSNSATAFATLTYATDTDWTQITTGQFEQHVAANQADPKYILVPPHQAYRYFAIKIANNWGNGTWLGYRRVELQEMI